MLSSKARSFRRLKPSSLIPGPCGELNARAIALTRRTWLEADRPERANLFCSVEHPAAERYRTHSRLGLFFALRALVLLRRWGTEVHAI